MERLTGTSQTYGRWRLAASLQNHRVEAHVTASGHAEQRPIRCACDQFWRVAAEHGLGCGRWLRQRNRHAIFQHARNVQQAPWHGTGRRKADARPHGRRRRRSRARARARSHISQRGRALRARARGPRRPHSCALAGACFSRAILRFSWFSMHRTSRRTSRGYRLLQHRLLTRPYQLFVR